MYTALPSTTRHLPGRAAGRPFADLARPATVNGAAGLIIAAHNGPLAVVGFSFAHHRIAVIDLIADPDKLRRLDLVMARDRQSVGICRRRARGQPRVLAYQTATVVARIIVLVISADTRE